MSMENRPPLEELLKISVFEWARLGAELGVSQETLKEIERRYPNNEAACRRDMFTAWVESEGEVTRAAVLSALKAMQDYTSAEWYEAYCKRLRFEQPKFGSQNKSDKNHLTADDDDEAVDSSSNEANKSLPTDAANEQEGEDSAASLAASLTASHQATRSTTAAATTATDETTPLLQKAARSNSNSNQSTMGAQGVLNCFRRFLQIILAIVNIAVMLLGFAVLVVGIWAQVRGAKYFIIAADTPVTQIPILLIIIGVFTLIFGVIGLVGAIVASKIAGRIILGLYGFVLLLLIVMEIAGGIAAGVKKDELTDAVFDSANSSIFNNYATDSSVQEAWSVIQMELKCCGASSFADYNKLFNNNSAPSSCCDKSASGYNETLCPAGGFISDAVQANQTGLIYRSGCSQALESFFQDNLAVVAGIAITFGLLQIIGVCMSCFVAVVGPQETGKYEVV